MKKKKLTYQPDLLYHTVMTHNHIPYSLNRLGIDGLALVHPVMVLSENRTIHRDTALVSMQRPLVLYYVALAADTSKKKERKKNHFNAIVQNVYMKNFNSIHFKTEQILLWQYIDFK